MGTRWQAYVGAPGLALAALGCGDDSQPGGLPWANQRTRVVGPERQTVEVDAARGADCIEFAGACLKPHDSCGERAADIVLAQDGALLDYLCYPGDSTLSLEQLQAQAGDVAQRQNNALIWLDDRDDGVDLDGDLTIDANNVVIYGEVADRSVISGSVTIDGNNALVRGVRVQGDVKLRKNNATLALCTIEGDLVVEGNNALVLACDVFGQVTVTGNNLALAGNRIEGSIAPGGNGLACRENLSFSDADEDRMVDPLELGAALDCE